MVIQVETPGSLIFLGSFYCNLQMFQENRRSVLRRKKDSCCEDLGMRVVYLMNDFEAQGREKGNSIMVAVVMFEPYHDLIVHQFRGILQA